MRFLIPRPCVGIILVNRRLVRLINEALPGAGIYFGAIWNKAGRVKISGQYPDSTYREDRPSITVSATRDAAKVAQDIQRRFLEVYVAKFIEAMEAAYSLAMKREQARDAADELAAILGVEAHHEKERSKVWCDFGTFTISEGSDGPYIYIERIYHLTTSLACGIAQAMRMEQLGFG